MSTQYLFTYGTLRSGVAATHVLPNYRLCFAQGETFDFPYVVPEHDVVTYGNIVGPVNKAALKRLDEYENIQSDLYVREQHVVIPKGGGSPISCYVYVAGEVDYGSGYRHHIPSGDWYKH